MASGKAVLDTLKAEGFEVVRKKGSHYFMKKGKVKTTVPVHGKKDLRPGTLAAIERQTGIKFD